MLALIVASPGCKKNEPAKTYRVSQLNDGTNATTFTYDTDGKLTSLSGYNSTFNLFYSGDKLVRRTTTDNGVLSKIDSIFYDPSGRIFKVTNWDQPANTLNKTTLFAFNADNTINTATVDFASSASQDMIFEYTYDAGKLVQLSKSVDVSGVYKLDNKIEFTAYDNKTNPLSAVFQKYLVDFIEAYIYYTAYPNNFTIAKQTTYDTTTGSVTGVTAATATYTYNSDNLPVTMALTLGGTTGSYTFTYSAQ